MLRDLSGAGQEAMALAVAESDAAGKNVILGEHVLRALLRLPVARLPVRAAAVFEHLRSSESELSLPAIGDSGIRDMPRSVGILERCNPEVLEALAQAWRLAILSLELPPGPDHILLGLLWAPSSEAGQMAAQVDVTYERAFLEFTGLERLPKGYEPRPALRFPTGERVELELEKLSGTLKRLNELLPDGAPRSFNHDYNVAWIRVDKGFEDLVRQAVADIEPIPE